MTKALVLGADGFIGRHIAFALRDAGIDVLAVARRPDRLAAMGFAVLRTDLTDPGCHDPAFWAAPLQRVDFVINAAGLLNGSKSAFKTVHLTAPAALYAAMPPGCRALLISAVGIDNAQTYFARFRRTAETQAIEMGVTVLRVGLVLADTSYGGSSLARGLAALPWVTPLIGGGDQQLNPIHATDLAQVVHDLLQRPDPGEILAVGGPEVITQVQMLATYRSWLGLPTTRTLNLPRRVGRLVGKVGDWMNLGPISTPAIAQMDAGLLAETSARITTTIRPFSQFVMARPAGTQDLWQARLYLLRPIFRLALILLWVISGLVGLLAPAATYLPVLPEAIPAGVWIVLAKVGGAIDLLIAAALLRGWRLRLLGWVQIGMVAGYTAGLTVLAPALWLLPVGGLLKNLPILVLLAVFLVLEDER